MKSLLTSLCASSATPSTQSCIAQHYAAVSLVVCGQSIENSELLYIKRARNLKDPWSGQIGFPGGRVDSNDKDHKMTAMREAHEEVDIRLTEDNYIGYIDTFQSVRPDLAYQMNISAFVFWIQEKPTLKLQASEVADALWRPLPFLTNDTRKLNYQYNAQKSFEAINLGKPIEAKNNTVYSVTEAEVLWGVSYKIAMSFLPIFTQRAK